MLIGDCWNNRQFPIAICINGVRQGNFAFRSMAPILLKYKSLLCANDKCIKWENALFTIIIIIGERSLTQIVIALQPNPGQRLLRVALDILSSYLSLAIVWVCTTCQSVYLLSSPWNRRCLKAMVNCVLCLVGRRRRTTVLAQGNWLDLWARLRLNNATSRSPKRHRLTWVTYHLSTLGL